MVSKSMLKYVNSLQLKKNRIEENSFLVEGAKSVLELLTSDFEIYMLFVTLDFQNKNEFVLEKFSFEIATEDELSKMSSFTNNNSCLAVVKSKPNLPIHFGNKSILVLDEIKDPGNLGTIIRIADWYGFDAIVCSENCVEFYNPKVIAATMGSFIRIQIFYTNLQSFLEPIKIPIYGAFLNGENIHQAVFKKPSIVVIGSESFGISDEIEKFISHKITIPRFGLAESLNAGVATGIFLDNFVRN